MSQINPCGLRGIEFTEFCGPDLQQLEDLFWAFGFSKLRRHARKNISYFRQNDIHFLLNGEHDGHSAQFARKHGPAISAMGWRVDDAQAALQADVIAPAEAQRQADVARAEGQRQSAILAAEAAAEQARRAGQAQADARKAAADALRVEKQAEADSLQAKLVAEAAGKKELADALRVEQQAEAAGIEAKLLAEAHGKKEIAAALNSYTADAARLLMLPDVLASVVKATEAAAMPLASVDRLSIIGGAGDTQDAVGGLLGVSPLAVAKIVEALKSSGIDVAAMLDRNGDAQAPAGANSHAVSPSE